MKKIVFVLFAVFLIGFYGCKSDKTKVKEKKAERVIVKKTDAQVKADIENMLDEMDTTWYAIIQADDQMLDGLQALHAKIGRSKNYEKDAFRTLISDRDNLKAQRFDRKEINNVAKVDGYDSAQIRVLKTTNVLIEQSKITETDSVAFQLHQKIQDLDSRVPLMRSDYEEVAKKYNQYLQDYKPQLQKLGTPYNTLQKAPQFVE